jgi:hypothetical protein
MVIAERCLIANADDLAGARESGLWGIIEKGKPVPLRILFCAALSFCVRQVTLVGTQNHFPVEPLV